jgi:diguanylate cyclase (GGDEF)-like protein/PAS domain S-box-containing protein
MTFEAFTGIELPRSAGGEPFEIPLNGSPSGQVAASGEMQVIADLAARPDFSDPTLRSFNVHTFVCMPMKLEGQVLGVISLGHPDFIEVDETLTGWVATLANHIVALYVSLRARTAVAENEDRIKLALEGTEVGLWDWWIPSEKIVVNARWAATLGYDEIEMSLSLKDLASLVHPEDWKHLEAVVDRHLAGQEQNVFELEVRARPRQGGYHWVLTRGRLVTWDEHGQPLRMVGTLRDIHAQRQAQENLRQRDAILEAVSAAAESFLASSSWETCLAEVIARLGRATQASRVFVFETTQDIDRTWVSRQHSEWVAPGFFSEMALEEPHIHSFESDGFERWEQLLSRGRSLGGPVADFPESEQGYLNRVGVRSLMVAPVFVGARWWGHIGLHDCLEERQWSTAEQDALRLAAGIFGAAIQRQETEQVLQRLYETEREQRQVSQALREAGIALSASLSFDSILDRILDELPRLIPYDAAHVLLVAGPLVYLARQRGYDAFDPKVLERTAGHSYQIVSVPALRWMIENRQPMIISDTRVATGRLVRLVEQDPFRSWAAAPISFQDQVVAFVCLEKVEPDFYAEDHGLPELLALFSNQSALSLQNARLFNEALEALEREHNLHAVTRAISSNLDLATILSSVVRLACDMAGADCGGFSILGRDGNSISYPFLYNLPEDLALQPEPSGQGLAWEVIRTRKSVLLADYAVHRLASKSWAEAGLKAGIVVPIIAGQSCLGGLGLFTYNPEKHFSERDLVLIESVGRQAGVAIQNARLLESAERRANEAETLRQAVAEVTTALELKDVLDKILFHLGRVVSYDSAAVFLYSGEHLHLMAGRNLLEFEELKTRDFAGDNLIFLAIQHSARPLVIRDVLLDTRFEAWRTTLKIRGWMGLPLNLHGEPIGYLTLDSEQVGAFDEQDAALVQGFADEVAIAIENARLFEQVQLLAITDPLTGLYNRRYFFEAARREFERSRRYQSPLAVILLDIDHFKQVNDTYGHLVGDQVLVTLGKRCRQELREVDVLARYGGEEFIFLLPETGLEAACQAAERVRTRIMGQPFQTAQQRIPISVSLGVSCREELPECADLQELVRRADLALYVTKDTGRGRVTPWQPEMDGLNSLDGRTYD